MTFTTRMGLGDKVWVVGTEVRGEKLCQCPVCNGTGRNLLVPSTSCNCMFYSSDKRYMCVSGTIMAQHIHSHPATEEITGIRIICNCSDSFGPIFQEEYETTCSSRLRLGMEAFATEEECQAECDRRNGKTKK